MMLDRNARQLTLILTVVSVASANNLWPSCSGKTMMRSTDLSCEEKQTILDEHNRLRQLVALGQINGQPSAANMREMIWDDELAAMAQRWTNRCAEIHDDLRNVRRFSVGQNMARAWTTRPPGPYDDQPNWRQMINGWFDEVHHYQTGYSDATGHYTQLVWGDTYLVGCGYSFYYDPARGYTKNYVCNYGPSGNVIGFKPYQSGQPACGNYGMLYSNRYAGLCSAEHYYYLGALCSYVVTTQTTAIIVGNPAGQWPWASLFNMKAKHCSVVKYGRSGVEVVILQEDQR